MQCPRCKFVSSEKLDHCRRCGWELSKQAGSAGIAPEADAPPAAGEEGGSAEAEDLLGTPREPLGIEEIRRIHGEAAERASIPLEEVGPPGAGDSATEPARPGPAASPPPQGPAPSGKAPIPPPRVSAPKAAEPAGAARLPKAPVRTVSLDGAPGGAAENAGPTDDELREEAKLVRIRIEQLERQTREQLERRVKPPAAPKRPAGPATSVPPARPPASPAAGAARPAVPRRDAAAEHPAQRQAAATEAEGRAPWEIPVDEDDPSHSILSRIKGGFIPRLVAALIDWAIVLAVAALTMQNLVFNAGSIEREFTAMLPPAPTAQEIAYVTGRILARFGSSMLIAVALVFVLALGYFGLFEGIWNRTPGKFIAGLRVVTTRGEPAGFRIAIVRFLGSLLSALPFGIGFLWALTDEERQGWHDKLAGTVVIKD